MRPIRLHIQGLTSYKQPIEIDFSDLDLFAITGPTGAGKTSLVDAITYALFGQAPRVGRNVKDLISQGAERLKVDLELSTNGSRYRIHRSSARRGQAPVQLEHLDRVSGEWLAITDRSAEATREIEKLIRMDYEAFIRSVLLPQGEFQQFLAGDRDERRKVLDGLLQLGVYALMHQKANQIAVKNEDDANHIRQRLETELANATPESLKAARQALEELKQRVARLAVAREAAGAASKTGEQLAEARTRSLQTRGAAEQADAAVKEARGLLSTGEERLRDIDERVTAIKQQTAATEYHADLHLRLTEGMQIAHQADRAEARAAGLAKDLTTKKPALEKLCVDAASAAKEAEEASATLDQAREAWEAARRQNAAAGLRQGLTPGDPCPVCGQKVGSLQTTEHVQLDAAKATLERASKAEVTTREQASSLQTKLALAEQSLETISTQLTESRDEAAAREKRLGGVLGGPRLVTSQIAARLRAQNNARQSLEKLESDLKTLQAIREREAAAIASAGKDLVRLEAELGTHKRQAESAGQHVAEAEKALREAAAQNDWPEVAQRLGAGADVVAPLRLRLEASQREEAEVQREIGACQTRIGLIKADIEKAKQLRDDEKTAREAASLARDLASLLQTNRFPTFIRERALQTLARDGSMRLNEISGGRYSFQVDGQDFLIVDRWNGGETRSVKTLSGGETFLASLALALALAERLPGLGGPGAESALDSLFIDEGFSHLDAETLDVVASALEVLGSSGDRLVGVITHVPALAERMPARITVHKSQTGSTITVD